DIIQEDVRSEPVHTAFFVCPDFTAKKPYFKAFIPEQQAPEGEFISVFPFLENHVPWLHVKARFGLDWRCHRIKVLCRWVLNDRHKAFLRLLWLVVRCYV